MAIDSFLKLGDLKGESQVKGFENQIQILAWSWGMSQSGTTHHGTMEPSDVSMRVIADHLRAMTFLIADGVIFIIHGDKGELVMAEANPAGYKELGRAKLLGGNDIWAPMALSNGMLVLRDHEQMKCVFVGSETAGD